MQHNGDRLLDELDRTSPLGEVITGFGCLAVRAGVLARALPFAAVNSFSPPLSISNREIDDTIEQALSMASPPSNARSRARLTETRR